jgi:5-methylcytosine-specific restriction endonuclease McrA
MEIVMEPRTLVLSPWMAPNRIATWQQAIVLVYLNKVDVLEEYDAEEHAPASSARWSIKIPAVLRIRKTIDMHKSSVKFSRSNMLARDGSRCCYCPPSVARKPAKDLTYDHVLPRCRGGKTCWENIVMACRPCNRRKDKKTPKEAGMTMHFKPHKPASLALTGPLLIDTSKIHPLWVPYMTGAEATG